MDKIIPLMRREWLQHRKGWLLLMGIPFLLLVLVAGFGSLQLDVGDALPMSDPSFAMAVTVTSILGVAGLNFLIVWITSLFIAAGISRRDQGDRSIEFWLSLPTSHSASLIAPLLVHLLLVPAAALVLGMVGGHLLSAVIVTRLQGFGAWLAMPWGTIEAASLATLARLLVGLPLATLWLLPLILLAVLSRAWIGRWGIPVLTLALSLGSVMLQQLLGQPLLSNALTGLLSNAAVAMLPLQSLHFDSGNLQGAAAQIAAVPGWVWGSFGSALRDLASPLMAGALVVSAACFAGLVQWRRQGAGAAAD